MVCVRFHVLAVIKKSKAGRVVNQLALMINAALGIILHPSIFPRILFGRIERSYSTLELTLRSTCSLECAKQTRTLKHRLENYP